VERRRFLRTLGLAAVAPGFVTRGAAQGAAQRAAQESPLPGQGAVGTLRDPTAAGRPRSPTDIHENDAEIQQIEKRLACTCGCTLDIFTCRTTDFTCTYSPALHREVLALWTEGKRGQAIVDAFVAKYGEKALMAPKPEGFNLAGYLVPGAAMLVGSGVLLAVLLRRRTTVAALAASSGTAAADAAAAGVAGPATVAATPEELERLRRALAEAED
jgi:cytochrome c-type biogenesis protein CcmH